jgi:hypothetical protein
MVGVLTTKAHGSSVMHHRQINKERKRVAIIEALFPSRRSDRSGKSFAGTDGHPPKQMSAPLIFLFGTALTRT